MSLAAVVMGPPAPNTITKEAARLRAETQLLSMRTESPWRSWSIVGAKKDILVVQAQQPDRWHPDFTLYNEQGLPVWTFHLVAVATKADYDLALKVFGSPKMHTLAKAYPTLSKYRLPEGRTKVQLRQHFSAGDTKTRHYSEPVQ